MYASTPTRRCGQDVFVLPMPEKNVTRTEKPPAILLFGMPGVGKGTQGALLGSMRGMFHVSTGAIFRALDPQSEDGQEVGKYIHRGELVPDDVTVRIWRHWLDDQIARGNYDPATDILVLDGIPRSVGQCELLKDHIDVLCVVHLISPDDEPIVQRLRSRALTDGRTDDADENLIRHRFSVYREKTSPVLAFYPSSTVHSINPLGTQVQIKKRILEVVIPAIRKRGLTLADDESAA